VPEIKKKTLKPFFNQKPYFRATGPNLEINRLKFQFWAPCASLHQDNKFDQKILGKIPCEHNNDNVPSKKPPKLFSVTVSDPLVATSNTFLELGFHHFEKNPEFRVRSGKYVFREEKIEWAEHCNSL
jgi:hypothetical protein